MTKQKVLITDYEFDSLKEEISVFEGMDVELVAVQCVSEDDVIAAAKDAVGIINQYAPITRRVIEQLDRCKVISRYGIGVDTVDVQAASEKGIIVSNVTDYCWDEVSDHTLALMMACARKVVELNHAVKNGNWDFNIGVPIFRLRGRILGLVGFGNIPQLVAKKAQAFGLQVIAYDPFIPTEVAHQLGVKLLSLEEVCELSDYVSIHAPLNERTKGMISTAQFTAMKKEAFLINTARGPIVDEKALVKALEQGDIAGAGLDVLEKEPISKNHPLIELDNVILNPHVAWYSEESQSVLKRKTAENVANVLMGKLPYYMVNRNLTTNLI